MTATTNGTRPTTQHVASLYADLLDALMPGWADNPHMADTPSRVASWWNEFLNPDPVVATTFPAAHIDQMVVVSGIDTWSLCAHHLLPFSARVSVGYIADTAILGLSKFARIAHRNASAPTSQEDLAAAIADDIQTATGSAHVGVTISGLHTCMAMRGVKTHATMTTNVTRGMFRTHPETRAEWLSTVDRLDRQHG